MLGTITLVTARDTAFCSWLITRGSSYNFQNPSMAEPEKAKPRTYRQIPVKPTFSEAVSIESGTKTEWRKGQDKWLNEEEE